MAGVRADHARRYALRPKDLDWPSCEIIGCVTVVRQPGYLRIGQAAMQTVGQIHAKESAPAFVTHAAQESTEKILSVFELARRIVACKNCIAAGVAQ